MACHNMYSLGAAPHWLLSSQSVLRIPQVRIEIRGAQSSRALALSDLSSPRSHPEVKVIQQKLFTQHTESATPKPLHPKP